MINKEKAYQAFPHDSFRKNQEEAYFWTLEQFASGSRFVVVELPTGVGKSAIATGVGRYFGDPTLIITQTKALQDQYRKELPSAIVAKGASNYYCRSEQTDCREAKIHRGGRYCGNCEYKSMVDTVRDGAGLVVANTDFVWSNFQQAEHAYPTTVIDEAHLTETKLASLLSLSLSGTFLKAHQLPCITSSDQFTEFSIKWSAYYDVIKKEIENRATNHGSGKRRVRKIRKADIELFAQLESYDITINKIKQNLHKTPWIIEGSGGGFVMKPVFAGFLSHQIFSSAKRILLMSATICDSAGFMVDLRIPSSQSKFISLGSPFPVENRPVIYKPIGLMSYENKAETLPKMTAAIDRVFERFPNERGMIHVGSYDDARTILAQSKLGARLIGHDSNGHSTAIKHLEESTNGILISPSMYEGVDLRDDLARINIITKVPYLSLGDSQVRARLAMKPPEYDGSKWYQRTAVMKIVQAAGRTTRSPEDFSITMILDSCFGTLWKTSSWMFPEYFRQALVNSTAWVPSGQIKSHMFLPEKTNA